MSEHTNLVPVKNVLISVFDKQGLAELATALKKFDIRVFATEGSKKALGEILSAQQITPIDSLTEYPEMFDGRVKTLHPKIFGGILARRNHEKDRADAEKYKIPLIDLVIGNLYPFQEHLGKSIEGQVPFIDIGGPSLLRAASKNHEFVCVASDPADYKSLIQELEINRGSTTLLFRRRMAAKTFERTSHYDSLIASEWSETKEFPKSLSLAPQKTLRYGENPHQAGSFVGKPLWKVLQGKELSYNNLLDADSAYRLVNEFSKPTCAIIKHNNPCGVASSLPHKTENLFLEAFSCDSKSAFGGVVAFNCNVTKEIAESMSSVFLEVVISPKFLPEAFDQLSKKKNLRLIEWPNPHFNQIDIRTSLGGYLLQKNSETLNHLEWSVVTEAQISEEIKNDLEFAWKVVKHVRSNAIALARAEKILGIGAGQMSRVDAVQIAIQKSGNGQLEGSVLASDAFFPFRDNIDLLKGLGIKAIIQPGGSKQDSEVITACNEHNIAMVFTGVRHFRH